MTRARKFSGKTVDEATEIALAELDAELEDVEIRVVSPGRSGILGLGGQPAEIEIVLLADGGSSFSDDDPDDVEDSVESSAAPSDESGPEADAPRSGGRTRSRNRNRGRGRGRGRNDSDRDENQQVEASAEATEAPSSDGSQPESDSSGDETSGGRRGGRGVRRSDRSRSDQREDTSDSSEQQPKSGQDDKYPESQPIIREKDEEAEQLVSELIDYFLGSMGVVADTYIREDDDEGSMTFEIEGPDAGLLIGRRGETLQALQFLIRMVTNRQLGRKAYVVIDIEDYRERRVQMLRRLARRMAGRVGSSGREDSLEPMSPAERRIVHMALAGHPEVRTESEGEGNQRRVVIFPK
jgi:spoIIIJ-associated protein